MSLTDLPNQKISSLDFLSGGGEMGERIRNFDWSKTPIGPPENWEQSLKTCVRIMLTSSQPIWIGWGKDLINLYNDPYKEIVGGKHPVALGQPARVVWKEIWHIMDPLLRQVMEQNEGTYSESQLLIMHRHGYAEEVYYTFSYCPVPGEDGGTAGMICYNTSDTERVINERSLKTLQRLEGIAKRQSEIEVYREAAKAIEPNNKDFPFGIIYRVNSDEQTASPVAFIGIESDQQIFPGHIDLRNSTPNTGNFFKAYNSKEILVIENGGRRSNIPTGFWQKEATHFIHIPIIVPGNENPVAVLSAALNPHRKFDNNYKQFAQLIADRIGIEINNILNYEQEKKRAAELAELDQAKTIFFSNISHEFRTPLTLMLGTIEEAMQDINTAPKNIERLDVAHRNAMRLLKLVNTLLDFSRIESGRQKAAYTLTDISALTKNLAGNFRSIIEKAGLKFIVEADAIIQPVYIDKEMWEKIVFNLLSNAFKYTLTGSITLKLYPDEKNVVLELADTGVGIPEKDLPRMFERFHRVENVVGRSYEGTGIGLSLTKELVKLHGGNISVKSKEGIGSTFTITVPFGKDHLPADQTFKESQETRGLIANEYIKEVTSLAGGFSSESGEIKTAERAASILVVDDNADMRQHLRVLLQKEFNVITAANGMEALHKVQAEKPTLILSDIMMPIMDGIQLLKEVKSNKETTEIPFVLLTARAGEESRIEGLKIGADDYLVKPFSAQELTARISAQIKIKEKRDGALQNIYSLFNEVPFAVAVLKGESLLVDYINKYNLNIWQRSREEVIGKPLFEVRPDLREAADSIHKEIYKTGKRYRQNEVPVTISTNNRSETRYFDAVIDPMFDEEGNIIGQLATSIEVTDKVLARKTIEESELELISLANAMPQLVWIAQPDGNITFYNDRVREFLGATKMADGNWSWEGLVHADDIKETSEAWTRSVKEGVVYEKEHRILMKNGSYRWHLSRGFPVKDEQGKIEKWYGTATDIHDLKTFQEKISESEEQNRLFIEHAPAAMAMFDKEMRYISASKQWMKEYDLTGNVIGQKHYELFPNILERWKEVHSRCLNGAIEISDDDFYVKDNGAPVWLKWKVYPWYNASNEIGGIVVFTENVTEQKAAERYVKESEERFRAMANEAPLFVWVTDEKLQTTYLNKTGLEYFDLDESVKMSELSWKKYIHPDDLENVLTVMYDAANKHESYTLEMRLKNGSTGKYNWFVDKGAPRYTNGKFVGFIGTSLNIHERKEAEAELESKVKQRTRELDQQNVLLKKQNTLVKKVWDSSVDLIAVYDTDTRIISANEACLKVMGVGEEAFGKKITEVHPGLENTQGHSDLLRAIAGETIHNEMYQSSFSHRYYENSLVPLRDDSDNVFAVLVMAHDNTELISSAKRLNEAFELAQIGHWEWEIESKRLMWSDNLYNIYGLKPGEDISFEKFIAHVHPDDRAIMQVNIEFALQSGTFNDFFHRIITGSGEEKIMHARGEVIVDSNDRVVRIVGTGQDVTRQKLIEQKLIETSREFEERNQFIEQLINSSLDLIMVIDKDLRFITVNKKAQLLYQEYYKENIIGKKITDFNPPIKGTENYNDILEAFAGKIIIKDKVKSTISDRYYEHNYVPLTNANGEVYAVMIISHDMTESMRQMEELRKLSESDVQKNNFIAMASHELKTPITSIKGYVQLLLNAVSKEKDEKKALPPLLVRSSLLSVDKQITRLTRLISELLDLSKIETGTLELKKEKFKLNELAIETVEDILYTNTRHQINLYHDHEGYVFADKDRIGQVMINFLTNAIKYSPDSNKIDVYVKKGAHDSIAFSVRDYGIGIDKEEQRKIFERFYRAKGKEEQTYPGFGIGLFIASEFVQKHGGSMIVESEKGKGAVFTFTLPVYIN